MLPVNKIIILLASASVLFAGSASAKMMSAVSSDLKQLSISVLPLPDAGSVPQGAQRVPVLSLRLTATCTADVPVRSISLLHAGLGPVQDFLRVYGVTGIKRVTRAVTVSAHDPLTLQFVPVLSVPKCGSIDVTVLADLSPMATAAAEHRFAVTGADADAVVKIAALPSANVRITPSSDAAQVTVDLLDLLSPVYYGSKQTVARLLLTGEGGKDQRITAITFQNDGSAANMDLQNFFLVTANGQQVSSVTSHMDGRSVRLELPSFVLSGRDTKLLQLKADVLSSSRRTIRWTLDPSDVEAQAVRGR